jgi:D-sedoheptulose 7-phosphate isomerase
MADAGDSKSPGLTPVQVQVLSPALGPRSSGMAQSPFQHQFTPNAARGVAAKALADAARLAALAAADAPLIAGVDASIEQIAAAFAKGNKVLICGNGGSLADATHFAEELTGRFRKDRPALAAIAIADAGHLTCTANDFGFDRVFSRGVEALGRPGDVLIALSTSGNSKNVLLALDAAKERGLSTIALLGKTGGQCKGMATIEIIVPGETADRIQELHMLILHTLVEGVEKALGLA